MPNNQEKGLRMTPMIASALYPSYFKLDKKLKDKFNLIKIHMKNIYRNTFPVFFTAITAFY